MKLFCSIFAIFACSVVTAQSDAKLFVITKNDRYGYIDQNGKTVIEPRFRNANDFSEGLASVREDGLYGFIDTSGKFVIAERYGYAGNFNHSLCFAYSDGKSVIINKDEKVVLKEPFIGITINEQSGNSTVYTKTGKCGLMDLHSGVLLADTLYSDIGNFYKGAAIARLFKSNAIAVLGGNGKYIVPPGIYRDIGEFTEDDVAIVRFDDDSEGTIDLNGKLLYKYTIPDSYFKSGFHSGVAVVVNYKQNGEGSYYYIELDGKVAYRDNNLKMANDFYEDRAIIETTKGYLLIDRNFRQVGTYIFSDVYEDPDFSSIIKDYLPARTDNKWGMLDREGNFTVIPFQEDMEPYMPAGDHFIFEKYDRNDAAYSYMIVTKDGKTAVAGAFDYVDPKGYQDGLLKVIIKGRIAYVNPEGGLVWEEGERSAQESKPLNIDFMLRAYNTAYSETERYNGWARSENFPKKIISYPFYDKKISLVIDTQNKRLFGQNYKGYAMYLANKTGDTVAFNASDSRLDIVMQALDRDGVWKDIEYCPRSWCGNSYHTLHLPPGEYWDFTIPEYEGAFKTKLRAVLRYSDGKTKKDSFSNEIDGSVNPSQFLVKQEYQPSGIMDPYSD